MLSLLFVVLFIGFLVDHPFKVVAGSSSSRGGARSIVMLETVTICTMKLLISLLLFVEIHMGWVAATPPWISEMAMVSYYIELAVFHLKVDIDQVIKNTI